MATHHDCARATPQFSLLESAHPRKVMSSKMACLRFHRAQCGIHGCTRAHVSRSTRPKGVNTAHVVCAWLAQECAGTSVVVQQMRRAVAGLVLAAVAAA